MRALSVLKHKTSELLEWIDTQAQEKGELPTLDQLQSFFINTYEEELDEYSLNNIGIIRKHLAEILCNRKH